MSLKERLTILNHCPANMATGRTHPTPTGVTTPAEKEEGGEWNKVHVQS